ncbi:unnamed protein product, partial [Meganyctiphanes norvegica]
DLTFWYKIGKLFPPSAIVGIILLIIGVLLTTVSVVGCVFAYRDHLKYQEHTWSMKSVDSDADSTVYQAELDPAYSKPRGSISSGQTTTYYPTDAANIFSETLDPDSLEDIVPSCQSSPVKSLESLSDNHPPVDKEKNICNFEFPCP